MTVFGRGGVITEAMLDRALGDVRRELALTGLATDQLAAVRVSRPLVVLNERVGFYQPGGSGTIAVPAVSLGRWREYRGVAPWTSVRDILRHEYAHALADHHPERLATRGFIAAFGAPHERDRPVSAWSHHSHVSTYAATMPSEDFAETMMVYLRVIGAIAPYRGRAGLYRKLRFVAGLARREHVATSWTERFRRTG